jgi:hypothetical protein
MSSSKRNSERQITMRAIRLLSQTAEALSQCIALGCPASSIRLAADTARICTDRVEHIAQYDIDAMEEAPRMNHIADDLEWLVVAIERTRAILVAGLPFSFQLEDIMAVATIKALALEARACSVPAAVQ